MDKQILLILFLAACIAAPILVFSYKNPLYGLLAYVFFFPLLPMEFGINLILNFRWQQFCALMFLLPALIGAMRKRHHLGLVDILVFLYAFVSSFSIFFQADAYSGFGQIYKNINYILLPFLAFRYIPKSFSDIRTVLKVFVLSGLVVSFEGIVEFFQERSLFANFPLILDTRYGIGNPFRFGVKRVFASFYDPVYFGTYIGIIAIIALYFVISSRKKWPLLLASFQIILTPFLFLFSQARTAVVSFAIIIPFWFFSVSKKRAIKIFLYSIVALLLVIPIFIVSKIQVEKLISSLNQVVNFGVLDPSALKNFSGRMVMNTYGLKLSWPPNLFGERTASIMDSLYFITGIADIGNGLIWKLCEEGLVPALLFMGLTIYFMVILFRQRSKNDLVKYLLLTFIYFWIADQITAQLAIVYIFWWILGGLAMCIKHISKTQYQASDSKMR